MACFDARVNLSHRRWLGLGVVALGVAVIVVDITVVNVAMPVLMADLGLDFGDAEWVNAIYAAVFATFLITLGRVGDLMGRRRIFTSGLVVFAMASLLAARADSMTGLIGARALQGLGAAMILPATLAIVNEGFRGRERAIAFGLWGSMIAGMAAVGPLLGGWLATSFTWRWVFLINVPVALALAIGATRLVHESRSSAVDGFDGPGFALASVGLFSLVLGIIEGPRYGWLVATGEFQIGAWGWPFGLSIVPVALGVGVMALVRFVRLERSRLAAGSAVLFDLRLFRIVSFRHGNVLAAMVGLGEFGLIFVVPLYLQTAVDISAMGTGTLLLAMAAGGFVAGPLAGHFAQRLGPRQVVSIGMGLESLAALGVAIVLSPDGVEPGLIAALFAYGVGVGLAGSQLASVILSEIPPDVSGQASGMQSTFRQVGAALGIAVLGTIFVTTMGEIAADRLDAIQGLVDPQRARIVERLTESAGWYVHALRAWTPDFGVVVQAAERSITDAARYAAVAVAAVFAAGTVLSRRLPDILRQGEPDRTIAAPRGR